MPSFVALLRGVNVGKARRVPMADWRELLGALGYRDVATVLNSGNAVFRAAGGTPARHASAIAAAIAERLHVDVPVVVKSARQLAAIVDENPLAEVAADPSRLLVAFAQDDASLAGLGFVEAKVVPPERFHIGRGAAYLLCPNGLLGSAAGEALLGRAGRPATTRNWATVLRLHALANAAG